MSKKYYPVINFETCIECGACVEKCSHKSIDYVGDAGQSSGCGCSCSGGTCQL